MSNGTSNAELQENLNQVIEALYSGLNGLAAQVRGGGSPEDIAYDIEQLAFDFCRRWPICRTAHNLDPAPRASQKKGPGKSQKKRPGKSQKKRSQKGRT